MERREIKNFYRQSDGATASEIQIGDGFGNQLQKDMKYASNITYNDGLTEEVVNKWKEDKKNGVQTQVNTSSNSYNTQEAVPF